MANKPSGKLSEITARIVVRNIAQLRAAAGITAEEAARRAGIGKRNYDYIEASNDPGKTVKPPSLMAAFRLMESYGLTLNDLVDPALSRKPRAD